MRKALLNFTLFQLGWFVCVLTGDTGAVIYTLLALTIHALFFTKNYGEWLVISALATIGICWDYLLIQMDVLHFTGTGMRPLPLWLICLWLLFATTLNHALAWLQDRLVVATLFAVIFAPLTYLAGARLNDSQLGSPVFLSAVIIALGWALIFPVGLYAARQLKHD